MMRVQIHYGQVRSYHNYSDFLKLYSGGAPYDGSATSERHGSPLAMEIIYSILPAVGLIFTVVCFFFNLLFRNAK